MPDERAALNSVVRRFEPLCTPGESDIAIWRAAKAFWLERAAKKIELLREDLALILPDLTPAQSMAVTAVLKARAAAIRALAQEADDTNA
jgi:hypothetical protein